MESETLAREAQRILAGLDAPALASIRAHVYRAQPDFEGLLAIERSYVPGQPPPSPPAGSWLAFVYSKPTIEAGCVNVHVLECVNARGELELWIKLKRAEAVRELFPGASAIADPGAAVNRFVWQRAAGERTRDRLSFGEDLLAGDGPAWLRTEIEIAEQPSGLALRAPFSQSPLDAPPRFAGMHYLKTLSFAWAEREAGRG